MEAKNFASSRDPEKIVELIVRPNNRYGGCEAGERVIVDRSELRIPSTRAACMTQQEYDEAEEARVAREKALLASKKRPVSLASMVDATLQAIADRAAATVEKAVEKAEAEQLEAEAEAAEHARLAQSVPSSLSDSPKGKSKKKG